MSYKVVWHEKALDDLKGIDKQQAKAIVEKARTYLSKDPLSLGKPLKGMFKGLYRYRFGDYRIIYAIDRKEKLIIVLKIGARKDIYKS
ncbi:MAG TPA: type II toxin-antitoxin system RelE/ParE family toxin [Syntrophales bacterium]|nr:type II toxin-antitoxin system RelE/ParE family toxin [Syntrophales bacterium]